MQLAVIHAGAARPWPACLGRSGSRGWDVAREPVPLAVGSVWTYRDAVGGEIASVRVTGRFDEPDTEAVEGNYEPSAAGELTNNPAGQTWYEVDLALDGMRAEMSYRDGSGVFVRFSDQYPDLEALSE